MNLRPRRPEEPEIGLTPLIDVVFLLLIFFMVTTTFRKESVFDITLPQAARQPTEQRPALVVSIDAGGRYAVNDLALPDTDPASLRARLTELAATEQRPVLEIRADASTPHQAVVTVLDVAGQLGLQRIAIATLQRASDGSR